MKISLARTLPAVVTGCVMLSFNADALTIRTKGDLRLWQTVFDRTEPLAWNWEAEADAAILTFSNRLTGAVSSQSVLRGAGATRGLVPQPAIQAEDEALLSVTIVQTANGVAVSRAAADLACVPGADGGPISVRTKASTDWRCVQAPRLAAFDAAWWNAAGPSGYEVLWETAAGPHRVACTFEGVGTVDEVVLKFGLSGILLLVR